MQIRLDGIEQAMDKLNDDYGPEDDWIDDHQHLLVLRQQAQEALDEAIEKHAVVKRCITELTTFGTVRFYKDEIDVQTLDRVYRGTLTTPQLEKVARDLSALVARNLLKIRGVK